MWSNERARKSSRYDRLAGIQGVEVFQWRGTVRGPSTATTTNRTIGPWNRASFMEQCVVGHMVFFFEPARRGAHQPVAVVVVDTDFRSNFEFDISMEYCNVQRNPVDRYDVFVFLKRIYFKTSLFRQSWKTLVFPAITIF